MDKILQAFSDIADVLPRMDHLKKTFGDSVDFQQVLALIYSDIIEFHRRVYKFFRRKGWHLWFAFDWGLFERRFKSILARLSAHCDLQDKEAAAILFFEMKQMRASRQREDEEFEELKRGRLTKEVLAWLSAAEAIQKEHLHKLADKREPETCNWILDDEQMYSWIDKKGDPMLWMTGIPGAGKSFLSSLVIEYLDTLDDQITLYYFCGRSSEKDSCSLVLRTLANQLVRKDLDLAPLIHQAYLQKGSILSGPALKRMMKEVLSTITINSIRIILDGVDECDFTVQKEVLKSLIELQKCADENCKILISSRDTPEIRKAMSQKMHMKLDGKTTKALHLYIQQKVKKLKKSFPMLDPVLFQRVEQRLQEKADGMFLWVHLVTKMLKHQASELDFEHAIELLPEGLDAAYGLILKRFSSLDMNLRDRCFKILFWVCTTYRLINIHEVADGIALRPGQMTLTRKTRSQNIDKDILEICAPIIEKSNDGVLDLVHFSAKEYLLDPQSGPFIEVAQAHFSIAFSCIANLTSALSVVPRFSGDMTEAEIQSTVVQGGYGLQQYGQQYWAEHVRAYLESISSSDDQSKLLGALRQFSKVRKHNSASCADPSSKLIPCAGSKGLQKLAIFPPLHEFTAGWLNFRTQLDEKGSLFDSLEAQEMWQLHNDETFLSLLDYNLRKITEQLLELDPSKLPSHIREDDFMAFIKRFGFLCRFHNCTRHFRFKRDRDTHEASHIPSFPCLECDFSERGFRSRKDLEKHVQRYHMSMEDFDEIPDSLLTVFVHSRTTRFARPGLAGPGRSARCWNKEGRKVLQQGFEKFLDKVKPKITLAEDENNQLHFSAQGANEQANNPLGNTSRPADVSIGLNNIQEKIKSQHYQSLAEFKDDIRQISSDPDYSGNPGKWMAIETICDQELEKIFAGYPDFANSNPKFSIISKNDSDESFSDFNGDPLQVGMESFGVCSKRKPRWSLIEEEEFPSLIRRYGRDYAKISDFLKTKTVHEVEQHFLESNGGQYLSSPADDAADINLRLQSQSVESIQRSESTPPTLSLISDPAPDSSQSVDRYLAQSPGASYSYILHPDLFTETRDKHSTLIGTVPGPESTCPDGDRKNVRKKYIRGPPQKAYCNLCTLHPDGLFNEHSLKKHIRRMHTPTRKIWICVDISIDKMFLAKCKKCCTDKRYRSKLNAIKHLQAAHFTETTRMETLIRWIKEIEEPNPSYEDGKKDPSINGTDLPSIWEAIERPETNKIPSSRAGLDRLPALQNMLDGPSHSSRSPSPVDISESDGASHDDKSADEGVLNPNALRDDILFQDITFDNLLPSITSPSVQSSGNFESDPATRALIRPDQVPRLPHLHSFRRAACQDQVDALHERLNREEAGSQAYQDALDSLTHLSRTLRQNLVDWRRLSSAAPTIPLKI